MAAALVADPSSSTRGPERTSDGIAFAQWLLAGVLVGAGAVHVAMAPSHAGESAIEGAGFLIAAWLQVGLAVAVLLKPSRAVLGAVVAVSAVSIGAWAISRTLGLPFGENRGHAESVTLVDGVTVGMEVVAIVVAGVLASPTMRRFRSTGLAMASIVGVLTLTSAVLATPEARDHSHAAHGDEAASHSHTDGDVPGSAAEADDHGHGALTDLNGREVQGVKAQDVAHEMEPDVPLDPATRKELAGQLIAARDVALRYPTVADAQAAGYRLVGGGFGPGAGAHYIGGAMGGFDPSQPPTLIYAGTNPTSEVVGLMYLGYGASSIDAPEGFAGPNDHWHRHSGVCLKGTETIFPVDASVTEAQCTDAGGSYMEITTWMVHAWVVPGWESPAGVFSHENPNLRCADGTYDTDELGRCEGI